MRLKDGWHLTMGRADLIGGFTLFLFGTAAAAQSVVPLNGGLATVTFPRGAPERVTPPDGASQTATLRGIDEQLARSERDKQAYYHSYFEAQLNAPRWMADDPATGQFFTVADYELPANRAPGELSCETWLQTNPMAKWATDRRCKNLIVAKGQGIELRMTTVRGQIQMDREYLVALHRYSLNYSNWGSELAKNLSVPYVRADDSARFFSSFKF
jgi:hypothetical protein